MGLVVFPSLTNSPLLCFAVPRCWTVCFDFSQLASLAAGPGLSVDPSTGPALACSRIQIAVALVAHWSCACQARCVKLLIPENSR